MASTAHSLYCFEILAASLENHDSLELRQVEDLWARYEFETRAGNNTTERDIHDELEGDDGEMTEDDGDDEIDEEVSEDYNEEADPRPAPSNLRLASISRLQASSPASASTSSTPSTLSTTSSQAALADASKSSSRSSFFSFRGRSHTSPARNEEEHPLFVTWNAISPRGHKSLRGCIGTFEPHELAAGLKSYALTSAFDDTRFSPITRSELPSLANSITLLMAFTPCTNPLDWDIGAHGLRISFTYHSRRYGATYLPDVALEQGWTKEETILSLMRKAGWTGRSSEWKKVADLNCVRYEGKKASATYSVWREWREWVDKQERGR